MGSTIVLNVGKHVMFKLPTMTGHPEALLQIECKFDSDPRLIAGASTVVAHVARRAGLEERSVAELTAAAVKVFEEMARTVQQAASSRSQVHLRATEFPDRIEIMAALLFDSASMSGSNSSSGTHDDLEVKIRQQLKGAELDGLDVGLRDGLPHVTLVKKCGISKRKFAV
jgi:hypothetical protein